VGWPSVPTVPQPFARRFSGRLVFVRPRLYGPSFELSPFVRRLNARRREPSLSGLSRLSVSPS